MTATSSSAGDAADKKAFLENLVSNSKAPIFMKDPAGRYLFANDAYLEAAGLDSAGILGLTDFDLYPEEIAETYRHNDLLVMLRGAPIHTEEPFVRDGKAQTFSTMKVPVIDEKGAVLGICGISIDITEERNADSRSERRRTIDQASFDRLLGSLTPQEGRVLELLVSGLPDSEIAAALHLEVDTVRHHVSHLLKKLRKRSRTQAVIEMLKHRKPD